MRLELRIQDSHKTKTKFFFIDNNRSIDTDRSDHVLLLLLESGVFPLVIFRPQRPNTVNNTLGELPALPFA